MAFVTINSKTKHDTFTGNGEFHTISGTGSAWSDDATPALTSADFTGLQLVNYNDIYNDHGVGLRFTANSTGFIFNEPGGYIGGKNHAVEIFSAGVYFDNSGNVELNRMSGGAAIYLGASSHNVSIVNQGNIYQIDSTGAGISVFSKTGGDIINNSGNIQMYPSSGLIGGRDIVYSTMAGKVTTIVNSGEMFASDAAIVTHTYGTLHLTNTGKIYGSVVLDSKSALDGDTVINTGEMWDVSLGNGKDLFQGTGGLFANYVWGGSGNDHLLGGKKHDLLNGDSGNDRLAGQEGNDTLTGGAGKDHFVFKAALAAAGVDHITDFQPGIDKIDLSHAVFAATNSSGTLAAGMFFQGVAAHDANDRIIYNSTNGWLTYDSNGKATGGEHLVATLDPHLVLHNTDFIVLA